MAFDENYERLTQLTFTGTKGSSRVSLSAFDPLTQRSGRSRLDSRAERGSSGVGPQVGLARLDDVVLHS
jgi:hypothetical protein